MFALDLNLCMRTLYIFSEGKEALQTKHGEGLAQKPESCLSHCLHHPPARASWAAELQPKESLKFKSLPDVFWGLRKVGGAETGR